jgi:hypothetical protein
LYAKYFDTNKKLNIQFEKPIIMINKGTEYVYLTVEIPKEYYDEWKNIKYSQTFITLDNKIRCLISQSE